MIRNNTARKVKATAEGIRQLQKAEFSDEQAQALAVFTAKLITEITEPILEQMELMRKELKGDIEGLRNDLTGVRAELKGDIEGVKKELKADIKTEIKGSRNTNITLALGFLGVIVAISAPLFVQFFQ